MYKGPNAIYKEITTIPKGTKLYLEYSNDELDQTFAYVEYNGKKGWIFTYEFMSYMSEDGKGSGLAYISKGTIYTLKEEFEVYDYPNEKANKTTKKLEKNKEYSYTKSVPAPKSNWLYFKELNGWIYLSYSSDPTSGGTSKEAGALYKEEEKALVLNENKIDIYKSYVGEEKADVKITSGTIIDSKYIYFDYGKNDYPDYRFNVNVDGTWVWISDKNEEDYNILTSIKQNIVLVGDKELKSYKDIDLTKEGKTISPNKLLEGYIFSKRNTTYHYVDGEFLATKIEYANYDSKKYYYENGKWIESKDVRVITSYYTKNRNIDISVYLYEKNDSSSKRIGAVPANELFKVLAIDYDTYHDDKCNNSEWDYVEYLNTRGWIHFKTCYDNKTQTSYYDGYETVEIKEVEKVNEENNVVEEKPVEEIKDENKVVSKDKELDNRILIYIIIALSIAVAVLATIILVNKKKTPNIPSKDIEEPKETNNEDKSN